MAGRPANAKPNDVQSILDKANWELNKFDAKVANNMGKILDQYYEMAFDPNMKENTRLTILKDLIKTQKENVAAAKALEDAEALEKPRSNPRDDDDEEDDESNFELDNILSVEYNQGDA